MSHRAWRRVAWSGVLGLAVALAGLPATATPLRAAAGPVPESMPAGADAWAVLEAGTDVAGTSIPAPAAPGDEVTVAQATFEVHYSGFPGEAQTAFQAAVDIWESLVSSPVPIVIEAAWGPMDPGDLGGATPTNSWRNFAGAPQPGTWYVNALANARAGFDLAPAESDIKAQFNSGASWYFGTDGAPPAGHYDLTTAALHEIAHGLGFTGSARYDTGVGRLGAGPPSSSSPFAYDRHVHDGEGTALVSLPDGSTALGSQLVSDDLFFRGTATDAANGGIPVKLYAPAAWDQGSSVTHFDEATFPAGDPDSLMTPVLHTAEAIHAPGPNALGVLRDLGWRIPPMPVQRIFGQDAIDTSVAISQDLFAPGSAGAVVLARSDHFSDALAGGPLAAALDGSLLITPGGASHLALDPRVRDEIARILPEGGTVYVLGGPLALASGIDDELVGLGYSVVRVQGATQYSTATAIADRLGNPTVVFLATGLHFADALSAVPAAVVAGGAILLTDGTQQAPETAAYLAAHPPATRYAIGGPLAAAGADPGAVAVYGQDLYATSAAVATRFFPAATAFGAATGLEFPDALSGGVFMSDPEHTGPVLLVSPTPPLPGLVAAYLITHPTITEGFLFGGPLAVSEAVRDALTTV